MCGRCILCARMDREATSLSAVIILFFIQSLLIVKLIFVSRSTIMFTAFMLLSHLSFLHLIISYLCIISSNLRYEEAQAQNRYHLLIQSHLLKVERYSLVNIDLYLFINLRYFIVVFCDFIALFRFWL